MSNLDATELTGDFDREIWRSPDSNWCVIVLKSREKCSGNVEPGELIRSCSYRFVGEWKKTKHGPTFAFKAFVQHEPVSRDAIVSYLSKHCKGIGPAIAHKLVDEFGREKAISTLKNNPEECAAKIKLLNTETAIAASKLLKLNEHNEYAKMQLMELLGGYGFPHTLIPRLIDVYSLKAIDKVRKDPWCLLRHKFPGCGFLRVDKLYIDLGHPEDSIERQTFAAWHFMRSNMSGSTWYTAAEVESYLRQVITGGVKLKEAIKAGVDSKLIRIEKHDGLVLLADEANAREEEIVADVLGMRMAEMDGGNFGLAGEGGSDSGEGGIVPGKRPRKIAIDAGLD